MKTLVKYTAAGAIIGGILPAFLHSLKFTVFASVIDILLHALGALIGALTSLIIYKLKNV